MNTKDRKKKSYNHNEKKSRMPTLTSDKVDFKTRKITSKTYCVTIKVRLPRRHSSFKWVWAKAKSCKTCEAKPRRPERRHKEINNYRKDFSISLSTTEKRTGHKINTDMEELDKTANEKNLEYIYRTFHQTAIEHASFPNDDGI